MEFLGSLTAETPDHGRPEKDLLPSSGPVYRWRSGFRCGRVCECCRTGCTLKGMPEALKSEPVPLETGPDGVIHVRGTRITLDTVWAAFDEGATAEEIVQQYPSLSLADAYQAIGYCLRNTAEVAGYLAKRRESGDEVRRSNESRWAPQGIRARLLERRPH